MATAKQGLEVNLPVIDVAIANTGTPAQDTTLTSGSAQTQVVMPDGTHPDLAQVEQQRVLRLILVELRAIRILQAQALGQFVPDLTGTDVPNF